MLNEDEVAKIMKVEVPMLLHARIDELESVISFALNVGEFSEDAREYMVEILNKGVSL